MPPHATSSTVLILPKHRMQIYIPYPKIFGNNANTDNALANPYDEKSCHSIASRCARSTSMVWYPKLDRRMIVYIHWRVNKTDGCLRYKGQL
jgi:hypothetical protein